MLFFFLWNLLQHHFAKNTYSLIVSYTRHQFCFLQWEASSFSQVFNERSNQSDTLEFMEKHFYVCVLNSCSIHWKTQMHQIIIPLFVRKAEITKHITTYSLVLKSSLYRNHLWGSPSGKPDKKSLNQPKPQCYFMSAQIYTPAFEASQALCVNMFSVHATGSSLALIYAITLPQMASWMGFLPDSSRGLHLI